MTSTPDLRAFLAVAREGSFTRAATTLNLSQPALSRRIASLERTVGAKLFSRFLDGIRLTEAGNALLPHAMASATAWQDGMEAVRAIRLGENGQIDLAITNSLLSTAVIDALRRFQDSSPRIRLMLHAGTSVEVSGMVLRGQASFGLRSRRDADPRMRCESIGHEGTVIVASPSHPLAGRKSVTPAQISREVWIATPTRPGEPDGGVHGVLRHYGLRSERIMLIDSAVARKRLIESGFGIGMLARGNVHEELVAGKLVALNVSGLRSTTVPVVLVQRRSIQLGHAAQKLVGLLRTAFARKS